MLYFIVALVAIAGAIAILRIFGVFEIAKQPSKAVNTVVTNRRKNKKRKLETMKLQFYASVTNTFKAMFLSKATYDNHMYYIQRLGIRSEVLGRSLTPEELRGKWALFFLGGVISIPIAIFLPFFLLIAIGCFVVFFGYQSKYRMDIYAEDELIDNYFIDLYLLIYSKLRQGSRARLQGTVEQYIDVLESQGESDYRDAMLNLSKYLLNLLSLYEDHVAIPMLREVYHSATIINFCNVASQALQGIDNFDNLLTFKMQLVERKTNLMRKRQQAILRSGERSIYAIWIILIIFIAVGWYSKLPLGMFESMF